MAYILKFLKGGKRLDLMTGRYITDFVPPDVALRPLISEGTSANKTGGGTLIDTRAGNRSLSFTVHVRGLSDQEVARGVADLRKWIGKAGDASDPLYIQYCPNDDIAYEPLWGQRSIYYEVVFGDATRLTDTYGMADIRTRQADCQVTATVKPYALGKKQLLGSATGGVAEDVIGASGGISRGVMLSGSATNLFTNPVYGNSTWDTNWTDGSAIDEVQNTDPEFLMIPGTVNSAKLTSRSASNNNWTESLTLTAATYAISCFAMRPDGDAVSSSDMQLFYNNSGALTTTFTHVGDNIYKCTASFTGVASAQATGCIVKIGRCVYVTGWSCESGPNVTKFFYGDMLGCAWSGTAHASTSTRVTARIRWPVASVMSLGQGTISLAWKAPFISTFGNNMFLWSCASTGLRAYYQASDDKFYFTDGTNTASTSAQSFAAQDQFIFHFTWGPAGLALYKNGASAATDATYSPPATPGTYLYLGTDDSSNQPGYGPFGDFVIWQQELTSTEVLADYTNKTQVTGDYQNVTPIPYLWTKDGDDIVDNCDDSTRDNYIVCNGIPGSAPAISLFNITTTAASTTAVYMSLFTSGSFIYPTNLLYSELSGTATSTIDSGSAYKQTSISTSTVNESGVAPNLLRYPDAFDKEYCLLARLYDAGSALTMAPYIATSGWSVEGTYKTLTTTTSFQIQKSDPIYLPSRTRFVTEDQTTLTFTFYMNVKRTTGTANIRTDCFIYMPRPLAYISNIPAGLSFIMKGRSISGLGLGQGDLTGDTIELVPGAYNTVLTVSDAGTWVVADTLTYDSVKITPRYALL